MCTALPLDEIYPSTKFHNHSYYSFGDMLRTKFKYENKQRAITQKLSKRELWFLCTALPLAKIYPPTKFHNLVIILDQEKGQGGMKKGQGGRSALSLY